MVMTTKTTTLTKTTTTKVGVFGPKTGVLQNALLWFSFKLSLNLSTII